jgi:predicted lipid-binding transport protein (Tim44 family)
MVNFTRIWLPLAIAFVGVVAIVIGHGRTGVAGVGVGLLLIALIVWMINWMFRLSVESNRDRDREEEAREYFDRYGHWPGEEDR